VLKICSPDVSHKDDLRLVELNIASASEAAEAYERCAVDSWP